jgi:hypothetical protein
MMSRDKNSYLIGRRGWNFRKKTKSIISRMRVILKRKGFEEGESLV